MLATTTTLEQCRSIAVLMYKLLCLEMIHSLWTTYRKSGRGELSTKFSMDGLSDRKVWPQEVYSFLQLEQVKTIEDDQLCFNLVHHCLRQLEEKSEEYRRELRTSTSNLSVYTPELEQILEKFVQQELRSLHIEFNYQMALVHYSYMDELLQRYYLTQHPTDIQVNEYEEKR